MSYLLYRIAYITRDGGTSTTGAAFEDTAREQYARAMTQDPIYAAVLGRKDDGTYDVLQQHIGEPPAILVQVETPGVGTETVEPIRIDVGDDGEIMPVIVYE